ncbi:lipid-binding SYLF domain-containing protein [bacterium]|nr:lipid-binding SYLF domain-containing protein [bacterium]
MTTKLTMLLLALALLLPAAARPARADEELRRDAAAALQKLCAGNSAAALLRKKATGILVFPRMLKAGFLFGGQIGDGVLFKGGRAVGTYNSVAASYGLQAGGQTFGYAMFFMNPAALEYLNQSGGWEVGVGPSIVVVDEGMGKSITSTTLTNDVYAFIFNQKGLMGGLGIQGSKITRTGD